MLKNLSLVKKFTSFNSIQNLWHRASIHTSAALAVKEIVVRKEGKTTIIEGVVKDSERKNYVLKTEHDEYACPICRLCVDVKHTDVLILSQFVRKDGLMLPRRITGLCDLQQKRMSSLVSMAHIAGLMPNLVPTYSKPNCFKKRRDWKKYNTYFDESTIRIKDRYYREEKGIKLNYYKERGVEFEPEPWKNKVDKIDITPRKLTFY